MQCLGTGPGPQVFLLTVTGFKIPLQHNVERKNRNQ
jgi:hypothetical protein